MIEHITREVGEQRIHTIAPEVVAIADACLGGLYGRSALVVGQEQDRLYYTHLLQRAGMKHVFQETTPLHIPTLLSQVHLFIHIPGASDTTSTTGMLNHMQPVPQVTAAMIAKGCVGRRTPLLIFDLAPTPSVEELAGLLPTVCLYTPTDLRQILRVPGEAEILL